MSSLLPVDRESARQFTFGRTRASGYALCAGTPVQSSLAVPSLKGKSEEGRTANERVVSGSTWLEARWNLDTSTAR